MVASVGSILGVGNAFEAFEGLQSQYTVGLDWLDTRRRTKGSSKFQYAAGNPPPMTRYIRYRLGWTTSEVQKMFQSLHERREAMDLQDNLRQ